MLRGAPFGGKGKLAFFIFVTDTGYPGRILLVEQQVSLPFGQRPKQTHKRLSCRTVLANRRRINH
jgi:hypothetical protein